MSMKRILYFTLAAATLLLFSCSKDSSVKPGNESSETVKNSVTISVDIPKEGLSTKISFAEDESTKRLTKIAWEDDDVIDVYDGTTHIPFTIVPASISADGKTATFTGNEPAVASSYVITYNSLGSNLNTQLQNGDGTTGHLGYKVVKTVSDYKTVSFSGATIQSSVLQLRALLPDAIKNNVAKVIFKSNLEVFNGQKELTVALADGTLDANDRLDVYASIPEGDITLPDDMELLIQFQVSANAYDKYTAYRTFTSGTKLFESGGSQYIGINCSNILNFANASDASIGSATNPYLVGDQHQMDAMHTLMTRANTTYFKLVDDVDMTGLVWFPLNNGFPEPGGTKYSGNAYDKAIDFDGNLKTISNVATKSGASDSETYASIFGVLMGNVYDLTVDHATIHPKGKSGVIAGYVGTGSYGPSHCEVRNVTITNSTLTGGGDYCGVLAGQSAKNGNVFSSITIEDCEVSTTGLAAGCLAYFANSATVSDITVSGTEVTSSGHANSSTIPNDGLAGGIAARVNAAVDFDRCTFASGTVLGPTLTKDNTNSQLSRYVGGLVGYVDNAKAASFDDCHVQTVLIGLQSAPGTNNNRYVGGAFGHLGTTAVVGNTTGCSVSGLRTNDDVRNYVAGFVSYLEGGTIKNSSANSASAIGNATYSGAVGGFIGYCQGGTLYNNSSSVDVQGAGNPGGFIGWVETTAASFEKCSASGDVTAGANNAGGFCGIDKIGSSYSECSATGTVNSSAAYVGGLIGYVNADGAAITKCYSTSTVSGTNYVGGLVGVCQNATISKSYYNGSVTGSGQKVGGILGTTLSKDYDVDIDNCYSRGSVTGASNNQRFGGIVGDLGKGGSVVNCWSDAEVTGGRVIGGIVGLACYQTWSEATVADNTITGCIAWNPKVKASQSGTGYGSSGAVIGHTSFKNVFGNCYRRSDMEYKNSYDCSGNEWDATMVDQPNCDGTNWIKGTTPGTNASYQYQQPYYGVAAANTATVSSIARDIIGWDSSVWDFSTDLPTLK